jgi:hypothetical protein
MIGRILEGMGGIPREICFFPLKENLKIKPDLILSQNLFFAHRPWGNEAPFRPSRQWKVRKQSGGKASGPMDNAGPREMLRANRKNVTVQVARSQNGNTGDEV